MRVAILCFGGFDELDVVAPLEVLRRAAELVSGLTVELVTLQNSRSVRGLHGLEVRPDNRLRSAPNILIVPGGGWRGRRSEGIREQIAKGELIRVLRKFHKNGVIIASVCTGAMALSTAGLLEKRPATTHWAAVQDLRRAGAKVREARVIDDGDVITSGGVTSGLDLALWIVRRFYGKGVSDRIAKDIEYGCNAGKVQTTRLEV